MTGSPEYPSLPVAEHTFSIIVSIQICFKTLFILKMTILREAKGAGQTNKGANSVNKSAVLHRHLRENPLDLDHAEGHYLVLHDGSRILDASGGAAVACVGVSPL